jgi:hypothetical protein
MRRSSQWLLSLLFIILFLTSCNLSFSKPTSFTKQDPEGAALSVTDTVMALQNPERAEEGVWSLLAHLGIGVYTGDGIQIMPGSETSEASFWLYDFEIAFLEDMAGGPALPFNHYYLLLVQNGFDRSEEELLSAYRSVYARHPEAILVQLFQAMGMEFEQGLMLTPLQEWLLLLDTLVPPNGSLHMQSRPSAFGFLGALVPSLLRQDGPCGEIRGGGVIPFWGLMYREYGEVSIASIISAIEYYYIIHGPLIASAAKPTLRASRDSGHEGHEGEGDIFEYTVDVQVQYAPWQSIPVAGVSCGVFVDLQWQPLVGAMPNVPTAWEIPHALSSHGSVSRRDALTDQQGEALLIVQLQHEQAEGIGPYREETGYLQAHVSLREGFQHAGIYDERLLAFVSDHYPLEPIPVTVSWHEECDSFTVHYLAEMQQEMPMLSYNLVAEGPILVTINNSVDPPKLQGGENIPISGSGRAGECNFTVTGYDIIQIEGTVSPSEKQDPPTLNLSLSHEMDIKMVGGECYGGLLMPISSEAGELELFLQDGERLENTWGVGMISGRTEYELEVLCSN